MPDRANDRGLNVLDGESVVMLALWSLVLWERKVGRVALEGTGVDRFELARGLDRMLDAKAREHPVAWDGQHLFLAKTGEPYQGLNFYSELEPLLKQAENE